MLSLWANWLVTKFGLNSLKRYLWPVLYLWTKLPEISQINFYGKLTTLKIIWHICNTWGGGGLQKKYGNCNMKCQFMMANYEIDEFVAIV